VPLTFFTHFSVHSNRSPHFGLARLDASNKLRSVAPCTRRVAAHTRMSATHSNSISRRAPRSLSFETAETRITFAADPALPESVANDVLPLDLAPLPELTSSTALENFSATTAADTRGLTGAGQTVVVIDSGIAWDHTAFGGGIGAGKHIVGGWDFAENDANPYDDGPMGTHGTHVAGIIGSLDPRYPGLAPGADIVALRVFDDQGQGDFPRIEAALRWVYANRFTFANPITTVNLSLGARWNADGAPEWSIIEDELAMLEVDGIFIAVAAGNSFAKFKQHVGLAYPAASNHVVPVASVDANGSLSSFSQRSDRVIAAPGRSVMSAVPDYAGNFNNRADDFLTLSGTSMAAPHIAAASMLVREAFARAGRGHVTQDDIYAVLRDSADVVYDAITSQSYRVLNLGRTLDTVLLSIAEPTNPTPPVEPPVQEPAEPPSNPPATPPTNPPANRPANPPSNPPTQPPAQPPALPTSPTPTPAPTPDLGNWGRVASSKFFGQTFASGASRDVTATNSGVLTVEVIASTSRQGTVSLVDGQGNVLGIAVATEAGLRLDANVTAGQSYRIQFAGIGAAVDVRITNLVKIEAAGIYVYGTPDNDNFALTAGTQQVIFVNGARYEFASAIGRRVYMFGGEGHDTIALTGTIGYDAAVLRPGKVSLRTTSGLAIARDFESVTIDGLAGQDTAFFSDSEADENFSAFANQAELVGGSSRLRAIGFESIRARSFGGQDTATIHAASHTDQISHIGKATRLVGTNLLREVKGFESVATLGLSTVGPQSIIDVTPAVELHPNATAYDDAFRRIGRNAETPVKLNGTASDTVLEAIVESRLRSQPGDDSHRSSAGADAIAQIAAELGDARAEARWNRLAASSEAEGASAVRSKPQPTAIAGNAADEVFAGDESVQN
jgi:subtilisin family serine protease